ncbi:hypothetical protein CMI38_06785 [Candidatus Pacearchaeota archaeon]|jgi:hypothetical protein|nr:hypothetical protein [Candidatus Pacearchaeota archaeon]|tara:strand:- start:88 stop:303 length:216 start_codon:yes stop_codon:yes gene_type:complete
MVFNIEALIFYGLLLDSFIANVFFWFAPGQYKKIAGKFHRHFPESKGWCAMYFVLVLWVGFGLYRLGVLPW